MLIAEGIAVIELPNGSRAEVSPDQLDFQEVETTEREMGKSVTHAATLEFDDGVSLTWRVVEYPAGAFNEASVHGGAQLIRDFIYSFEQHEHAAEDIEEETATFGETI